MACHHGPMDYWGDECSYCEGKGWKQYRHSPSAGSRFMPILLGLWVTTLLVAAIALKIFGNPTLG